MKRATGVLSGSDRNLGGPGKSRHFGDSGSGTHSQRRGSADRPPDPRRAQSRRTATHPRPSCPQNTSGPPRCPARRTWSGRRRLRDDRRLIGEDHRRDQPPDHRTRRNPPHPFWGAPGRRCIPLPAPTRQTCSAPGRSQSVRGSTPTVTPAPSHPATTPARRLSPSRRDANTPSSPATSEKRRLYDALDK